MQLNKPQQVVIASLCCIATTISFYQLGQNSTFILLFLSFIGSARVAFSLCVSFVLFSYFRIHEALPSLYPYKIPETLAIGCILLLTFQLWLHRDEFRLHPIHKMILLFWLWLIITTILSTNPSISINFFISQLIKIIIMFFAISWLATSMRAIYLLGWSLILCGILIAAIAIYNSLLGIGLVEETRVTISRNLGSVLGDPNDLALVLLFPLSFSAAYLTNRSWIIKIIAIIAICILITAILATQSRGGLIGVAVILFMFFSLRSKSHILPVIMSGIGLLLLISMAGISDRTSGGSAEEGIDASAMGRIYAWQTAWNMTLSHPVTGIGPKAFYSSYYFYTPYWDGKNHAVHSTWLQILAETGFIGFAIFIYMIFFSIRRSKSLWKTQQSQPEKQIIEALYLGLIGFCASGTFLTQGFTWPLYILLAILIAVDQKLNTQQNLDKKTVLEKK